MGAGCGGAGGQDADILGTGGRHVVAGQTQAARAASGRCRTVGDHGDEEGHVKTLAGLSHMGHLQRDLPWLCHGDRTWDTAGGGDRV